MNSKVIIFLLICIVLFAGSKLLYTNTTSQKIEILEVENPNQEIFQKYIHQPNPVIFTKTTLPFHDIQRETLASIESLPVESKNHLQTNFDEHMKYYKTNTQKIINELRGEIETTVSPMQKVTSKHLCITQLKGVKKILLFSPNQQSYLYPDHTKRKSPVNFFVDGFDVYPKLEKTKFIEIECYPGHMLRVPQNWWWTSIIVENSLTGYTKID